MTTPQHPPLLQGPWQPGVLEAPAALPPPISPPPTPPLQVRSEGGLPTTTLSPALLPGLLRELLVEGGQHGAELYEGAGASWRLTK